MASSRKKTAVQEPFTKGQLLSEIAETTELSKKEVDAVMESLADIMGWHISKRGCGEFVFPSLFKIKTKKKPAVRARKGVNPFTGEEMMFKAKPASMQVRIQPLKRLKDFTGS
ncbi:HU family DNA-binding protein [Zooshikella ganghwensis]|uniref:HU family DNA-binding protein n=1 Tax=Zooshikella ganghwensis TaxID=202772 RepID=UPI0003F7A4B2|nr:HU family DNA-binding protein [Zooshikella ganghwensis]